MESFGSKSNFLSDLSEHVNKLFMWQKNSTNFNFLCFSPRNVVIVIKTKVTLPKCVHYKVGKLRKAIIHAGGDQMCMVRHEGLQQKEILMLFSKSANEAFATSLPFWGVSLTRPGQI